MAGDRYGVGIVGRRANSKECSDAYAMFDGEAEAVRVGAECWFGRSGFGRVVGSDERVPQSSELFENLVGVWVPFAADSQRVLVVVRWVYPLDG